MNKDKIEDINFVIVSAIFLFNYIVLGWVIPFLSFIIFRPDYLSLGEGLLLFPLMSSFFQGVILIVYSYYLEERGIEL